MVLSSTSAPKNNKNWTLDSNNGDNWSFKVLGEKLHGYKLAHESTYFLYNYLESDLLRKQRKTSRLFFYIYCK